MNVKMKAVMTPFPYSVELDDPIAKARGLMDEHRIRHLPVKDGCELVGLLTDRDLKLVLGPYLDIPAIHPVLVRHACVLEIFTVDLETPLATVAAEMARRRIGSAVVTKEGRLGGIFTAVDLCRFVAEHLGAEVLTVTDGGDAA